MSREIVWIDKRERTPGPSRCGAADNEKAPALGKQERTKRQ